MTKKPLNDSNDYPDLTVTPPEDWAVGMPAIYHSMEPAIVQMGLTRTAKLMTTINQKQPSTRRMVSIA